MGRLVAIVAVALAIMVLPVPVGAEQPDGVRVASFALGDLEVGSARSAKATRTVRATRRFSAVGVTWASRANDVTVSVRARQSNGWTSWREAGPAEDDRAAGRGAADLLWLGRSTAVEVTVKAAGRGTTRDVRVDLIDPGPGPAPGRGAGPARTATPSPAPSLSASPGPRPAPSTSPAPSASPGGPVPSASPMPSARLAPSAAPGGPAPSLSANLGPGASPSAAPGPAPSASPAPAKPRTIAQPPITSRAGWGADESLMTWPPEYAAPVKAVVWHHTATSNNYAEADVPAIMRSIYRFQAVSRGWGDIGYHVVVDRFGRLWEGRKGGLDKAVVGAHAGGFNYHTAGISVIGTYSSTPVPTPVIESAAAYVAWKLGPGTDPRGRTQLTGGGPLSRYPANSTITVDRVYPHRGTSETDCPGTEGMKALQPIRDRAYAITNGV